MNGTTFYIYPLSSFWSYCSGYGNIAMCWRRKLQVCEHWLFKSIDQHWTYFLSGSLNLVFKNTRIAVKQAMLQEDFHIISVQWKCHDTMYRIVNLEDTTDFTLLGVITHNTNPHWPTLHNLVWRLKGDVGNNHLLTDSGYDNHSCNNFSFHCDLNQVDLSTDLLDKVILPKVVIQPTKNQGV